METAFKCWIDDILLHKKDYEIRYELNEKFNDYTIDELLQYPFIGKYSNDSITFNLYNDYVCVSFNN